MPESAASPHTFTEMFVGTHAGEEPATLIFDDADNLATQTPDTIADFLLELRELRQRRSSLRGIALLGTHKLPKIIEHRNWSPNHALSPFNVVRGTKQKSPVWKLNLSIDITAAFDRVSSRVTIAFHCG